MIASSSRYLPEMNRVYVLAFFFFSSRRRHTRLQGDWSSDVCSSDLPAAAACLRAAGGSTGPAAGACLGGCSCHGLAGTEVGGVVVLDFAGVGVDGHAAAQGFQRLAVEMEVQRGLLAHDGNAVDVIGQEGDGGARLHGEFARQVDAGACGVAAVVRALVESDRK